MFVYLVNKRIMEKDFLGYVIRVFILDFLMFSGSLIFYF